MLNRELKNIDQALNQVPLLNVMIKTDPRLNDSQKVGQVS